MQSSINSFIDQAQNFTFQSIDKFYAQKTDMKIAWCGLILCSIALVYLTVRDRFWDNRTIEKIPQPNLPAKPSKPCPKFLEVELISENDLKSLKEEIAKFQADFELNGSRYIPETEKVKGLLRQMTSDFNNSASELTNLPVEELTSLLNKCLTDIPSFAKNIDDIVWQSFLVLQNLAKNPKSKELYEAAQIVYKRISNFLRENAEEDYINKYERYLKEHLFSVTDDFEKPSCYLFGQFRKFYHNEKNLEYVLDDLFFVLKHLRKQIKIFKQHKEFKPSIELTWLHGSKANVISSACQKTEGKILPSGELRKKNNISILTGDMQNGMSYAGINQSNLSGVSLIDAKKAISYSNLYKFDVKNEIRIFYNLFLTNNYSDFESIKYADQKMLINRASVALERIKNHDSEEYEVLKELAKKKLNEIYICLRKEIFCSESCILEIAQDKHNVRRLYNFLKDVENMERVLSIPAISINIREEKQATIPVIFASNTKYGIPRWQLRKRSQTIASFEEAYPGSMQLGEDIQIIFTKNQHVDKVKKILKKHGLQAVDVKPMKVLKQAAREENAHGMYFYDVYNVKKWKKRSEENSFIIQVNPWVGKSENVEIRVAIARVGNLELRDEHLAEIFRRVNRYTLNRQYPIQNTSQKINEILVHRPNHNGTHSARKVRILESLFDFIEKKGSEEAKKELFHLSESQRLNLKLCTYLMRSGRVDESQSKGSLDNHYLRAALIYDEYAKQLKLSEEDRQWGKNIIANACLPKELVDKEFISEPKNYFAYILLSTVHDLDLVRCFSGSYFDENVKPLIQERMSFMSAQDPLDLNFELLIDFAKKLCGATGSPIYYDRIEMQKNLFAECSIEGDVCWEKVQSVALPQWM